jgi:hypothetical protein
MRKITKLLVRTHDIQTKNSIRALKNSEDFYPFERDVQCVMYETHQLASGVITPNKCLSIHLVYASG